MGGEVDLGSAPQLGLAITAALADRPKALAVDLSGVTFCDSTGLTVLVRARKEAEDGRVDFRVTNPSGLVASVLTLTGLFDHLHVTIEPDTELFRARDQRLDVGAAAVEDPPQEVPGK